MRRRCLSIFLVHDGYISNKMCLVAGHHAPLPIEHRTDSMRRSNKLGKGDDADRLFRICSRGLNLALIFPYVFTIR